MKGFSEGEAKNRMLLKSDVESEQDVHKTVHSNFRLQASIFKVLGDVPEKTAIAMNFNKTSL